ncbi:HypC/HybG/HupF family hydrogenase formation chaperone [Diaphorobacter sp. HDW4A]|uniref:HypC/HybG/HupF family hydrogenase formation chaperone n=1 Tax=Diaphorobacter sp. HDW4A TaxID=2714924 RepID=UPI0014080FE7|nr:HypC/HybG/HupF family hydrogenase formation chaperone [Diaphorobacter sp. HDW4A]QIL79454.1 HypC/HybG/HupF family hydrogenase formation chaperone [Diaphorobacter sp. HDW4A]
MCLAIPARIVEILQDARAVVDLGGIRKNIDCSLVGDVALDEYVVVHVGFAIGRIDPEEAERTLALFAQMSDAEKAKAEATSA